MKWLSESQFRVVPCDLCGCGPNCLVASFVIVVVLCECDMWIYLFHFD